jgi:hypothetical protein
MYLNDLNYTNSRLYEFFKIYPIIKQWLDTPWSSIKGLFYNLVSFTVPCTAVFLSLPSKF